MAETDAAPPLLAACPFREAGSLFILPGKRRRRPRRTNGRELPLECLDLTLQRGDVAFTSRDRPVDGRRALAQLPSCQRADLFLQRACKTGHVTDHLCCDVTCVSVSFRDPANKKPPDFPNVGGARKRALGLFLYLPNLSSIAPSIAYERRREQNRRERLRGACVRVRADAPGS